MSRIGEQRQRLRDPAARALDEHEYHGQYQRPNQDSRVIFAVVRMGVIMIVTMTATRAMLMTVPVSIIMIMMMLRAVIVTIARGVRVRRMRLIRVFGTGHAASCGSERDLPSMP